MTTETDFKVSEKGPTRGAWLRVPQGLLSVVQQTDMGQLAYVGVHVGQPEVTHSLPYALTFGKDGELMLQIPNQENPREPIIVTMKHVEALVKAAKVP